MGIGAIWNSIFHPGAKPAEPAAKTPAAPALGADPIAPDPQRGGWAPRGAQGAAQPFSRAETKLDGWLIGKNGVALPPGTPLDAVAKVVSGDCKPQGLAIYVNGIANTVADQVQSMDELSKACGKELIGVHNATGGLFNDVSETIGQKLGVTSDKPAELLTKVLLDRIDHGLPTMLIGHSQGALMISDALCRTQNALMKRGLSRHDAEQMMSDIQVETFAPAASYFPDGPQYVHYVNDADPVANWLSARDTKTHDPEAGWGGAIDRMLGKVGIRANIGKGTEESIDAMDHPGRGAVIIHFKDDGNTTAPGQTLAPHLLKTYLKHRIPFDEARMKASCEHFCQ